MKKSRINLSVSPSTNGRYCTLTHAMTSYGTRERCGGEKNDHLFKWVKMEYKPKEKYIPDRVREARGRDIYDK